MTTPHSTPSPAASGPARTPDRGSRRGLARWVATLLLVLHASTAGVLPVLDGSLESSTGIVAHWEDASYSACPTAHDNAACRVCQLLGSGQETAPRGVGEIMSAGSSRPPLVADASRARPLAALGSNGPRAPPVV